MLTRPTLSVYRSLWGCTQHPRALIPELKRLGCAESIFTSTIITLIRAQSRVSLILKCQCCSHQFSFFHSWSARLSSLRLCVRSRARVRRFAGVEASLGDLGALAMTQCHATDTGSQHDCVPSSSSGAASSPPSPSQSLSAPLTPAQWCELLRGHDMRLIVGIYSSWCEVRTTLCIREWQYEMFFCVRNQRRSLQRVFESHA